MPPLPRLAKEPDLLILDDPFDGLDLSSRRELRGLLEELHREGCALLIITNRGEDLPPFVSRLLLLAGGRLVFDGPVMPGLRAFRRAEPQTVRRFRGILFPETANGPNLRGLGPLAGGDA